MTSPVRFLLIGAAVAATLSACQRREDKAPDAPPPAAVAEAEAPVTSADAAAPLSYDSKNQFASVKLSLPAALKGQPDLHARLYAGAVRDLRQFVEGAQADRTEAGGDGGMAPYEKLITVEAGAETGKLFSLRREDYDFTGGAHGNTLFTGVLWDKALKRQITIADLFRKGADFAVLDQALCNAVNQAKGVRSPGAQPVSLTGKDWSCPPAAQTPFVLTPGTVPGKAGGLTFMIGAYQVGPYSDGAYSIAVPQSVFRALLNPAYADEFAGQPVKSGDVTPTRG
ncbi:DUF3298 and DUF4163 domain-containing protein [Brevundimonas sp.]|uniref:DUF3298 and DUF4163 domain-containing protein n=1 Tax=Brevundimonas sp. TaxID=1871086 RepID=UPI0025B8494D|nr:DUF3298 and DUF4163 domain-containing protein [Brevundimonas sp.]